MRILALLVSFVLWIWAQAEAKADDLKLLISVEQQTITAPFPVPVTLHLHNSGQVPLWLYRRVRDATTASHSEASRLESTEGTTNYTTGGSTLTLHLVPAGAPGSGPAESNEIATLAQGTVLESVGLPHPKLVKLAPGEDYEEKTVIHLSLALIARSGENQPVWGHLRLSVIYGAKYSNAEEIARNLGVIVWQGEVTSNEIDLELRPPAGAASVAGTVTDSNTRPLPGVLVSLSDQQERLVDQAATASEGRFSFAHLPFGLYWVTARRQDSQVDTATFRHLTLAPAKPAGTLELVLLPPEIYESKQMLHKPVLFRVTDSTGHPADKTTLEITWSSGTVLENMKGQVSDDGTVALELIPGRNYVTLRRRGCPKQEERADVAEGGGIDGFKLTLECAPK